MGKEGLTGSVQVIGRGCPEGDAKFVLGPPRDKGFRGLTVRTATAIVLCWAALALGGCGSSIQSMVPDVETFRPPDAATLFRPLSVTGNFKDKALPPVSPQDLVDTSLASLSMGELFCFPRLDDPEKWNRLSQALKEIGTSPNSNRPAARYGLGAPRGTT